MREAIILAGGLGTRLKSVVPDVPKGLAPIQGQPFLRIMLSMLASKGFHRVIMSLGYEAQKIIDCFGDSYAGMTIKYAIESAPLGTGGGIRLALEQCETSHACIFNGDTYIDPDIKVLEEFWAINRQTTIVCKWVDDCARYGRIEIKDGFVTEFKEKGIGGPGFINAGCYVLGKDALEGYPSNVFFSFEKEYLQQQVKKSGIRAFRTDSLFIDIGVPEDYVLAQDLLDFK